MISDRLYSIFLKVTGAALLLALFVMMASAVILKGESETSLFHIEVKYSGEPLIHSLDIRTELAKKFPGVVSLSILASLDLYEIEHWIESFPAIEEADVFVDASGRINLLVKQRSPILRIYAASGFRGYMDASGHCFEASSNGVARLPVVTGRIAGICDPAQKGAVSAAELTSLGSLIAADDFLQGLIEQIHIQDYANVYLIPKIGNQKILLGDMNDLTRKMEYLNIFYKEGLPRKGFRTYSLIDLRFDGQVVCKRTEN